MKVDVVNIEGKSTGRSVELSEKIFGIEPNEHVMYLAVKQFLANQRQGTHKTKERGEIKGSTRKIKKQKGTGTARAGSIKNPLFRGGGRVFGPRPRTYTVRLNKKVKSLARLSALSQKARNGEIVVMEDFSLEAPKTSAYLNILNNLNCANLKSVVVTENCDNNLQLSARNLKKSHVSRATDLNTYEILNANRLLLSESAVNILNKED